MEEFKFESLPVSSCCRRIEFEKIEVIAGFPGNFLIVNGTKSCINMEVRLIPFVYKKCPEYWGIEVVGYLLGGICLEALGPYSVQIPLTGITGLKGIEVIGANKSERCELKGGCEG